MERENQRERERESAISGLCKILLLYTVYHTHSCSVVIVCQYEDCEVLSSSALQVQILNYRLVCNLAVMQSSFFSDPRRFLFFIFFKSWPRRRSRGRGMVQ